MTSETDAAKLAKKLLAAGLAFEEPELLESYYKSLKGVFVAGLESGDPTKGMYLDLNFLPEKPINLKEVFIKWLIQVNLPRVKRGEEPIMPLSVVLKCPIWKVISPPLRRLKMTPEGSFNHPTVQTVGKKQQPGRINKK